MVPVLSRATTFTRPLSSSADEVLKRIPFLAPTPFPTMMATGVASPSAQGQLITRTDTALAIAKPTSAPTTIQIPKVSAAMARTTGTKMAETLSAAFAIGALVAAASETRRMICESAVSPPTFSALQTR